MVFIFYKLSSPDNISAMFLLIQHSALQKRKEWSPNERQALFTFIKEKRISQENTGSIHQTPKFKKT